MTEKAQEDSPKRKLPTKPIGINLFAALMGALAMYAGSSMMSSPLGDGKVVRVVDPENPDLVDTEELRIWVCCEPGSTVCYPSSPAGCPASKDLKWCCGPYTRPDGSTGCGC